MGMCLARFLFGADPEPPVTARLVSPLVAGCQDGNLYVADFGNFCVVRFATTEGNDGNGPGGRVVVGQRGKQLLDVDYLKELHGFCVQCLGSMFNLCKHDDNKKARDTDKRIQKARLRTQPICKHDENSRVT